MSTPPRAAPATPAAPAAPTAPAITIPASLLPRDGRFGSGPSKVRPEQVAALSAAGTTLLGTSHRQAPVRALVQRVRAGLAELFALPEGYEVVLGNGGSTLFWDVAALCLVAARAQHVVHGEFGERFAAVTAGAPFLRSPDVRRAPLGDRAAPSALAGVDTYAWAHNETSTGVLAPVARVPGADDGALVLVDGTSAAGGVALDVTAVDAYYFAPQKSFASDGGLWLALLGPAALERAGRLAGTRWVPASLDLLAAVDNSRRDQTLNTPAVATLVLLAEQVDWLLERGGLAWAAARTADSSGRLYRWAEASAFARPFVTDEQARSPVVATVALDGVDPRVVAAVLRAHGVLDLEPYRGRADMPLRAGLFPAVDPDDVDALTACIDHVVEHLA